MSLRRSSGGSTGRHLSPQLNLTELTPDLRSTSHVTQGHGVYKNSAHSPSSGYNTESTQFLLLHSDTTVLSQNLSRDNSPSPSASVNNNLHSSHNSTRPPLTLDALDASQSLQILKKPVVTPEHKQQNQEPTQKQNKNKNKNKNQNTNNSDNEMLQHMGYKRTHSRDLSNDLDDGGDSPHFSRSKGSINSAESNQTNQRAMSRGDLTKGSNHFNNFSTDAASGGTSGTIGAIGAVSRGHGAQNKASQVSNLSKSLKSKKNRKSHMTSAVAANAYQTQLGQDADENYGSPYQTMADYGQQQLSAILSKSRYKCNQFAMRPRGEVLLEWMILIFVYGVLQLLLTTGQFGHPHRLCIPGEGGKSCSSDEDVGLQYHVKTPIIAMYLTWIGICSLWAAIGLLSWLHVKLTDLNWRQNYSLYTHFCMFEALFRQFVFTGLFVEVTTNAIKYCVGRPRPNYYKLKESGHETYDEVLSFPSGHTSVAFALLTLLSIHLFFSLRYATEHRYNKRLFLPMDNCYATFMVKFFHNHSIFYIPAVQALIVTLPMVAATFVGITRIISYWHHYSDLCAGIMLGVFSAVLGFGLYAKEILPMSAEDKNNLPNPVCERINWIRTNNYASNPSSGNTQEVAGSSKAFAGPPIDESEQGSIAN